MLPIKRKHPKRIGNAKLGSENCNVQLDSQVGILKQRTKRDKEGVHTEIHGENVPGRRNAPPKALRQERACQKPVYLKRRNRKLRWVSSMRGFWLTVVTLT